MSTPRPSFLICHSSPCLLVVCRRWREVGEGGAQGSHRRGQQAVERSDQEGNVSPAEVMCGARPFLSLCTFPTLCRHRLLRHVIVPFRYHITGVGSHECVKNRARKGPRLTKIRGGRYSQSMKSAFSLRSLRVLVVGGSSLSGGQRELAALPRLNTDKHRR